MDWRSKDYQDYRTGLTWGEVWQMLYQDCQRGKRKYITRHTVLGKWHQIKLAMYRAEYGA